MPWNSPKRPPYWNSTSGFHFAISPQSTCHSAPNCEILSKSDHPQQKKMTFCRFSRWRISAILDFRGPIMGSLRSSCTTSYRSSINIMALNCLVFEKIAFFSIRRQTDRQTKKHMDTPVAWSRSRCRERRLNNGSCNAVATVNLQWLCCAHLKLCIITSSKCLEESSQRQNFTHSRSVNWYISVLLEMNVAA